MTLANWADRARATGFAFTVCPEPDAVPPEGAGGAPCSTCAFCSSSSELKGTSASWRAAAGGTTSRLDCVAAGSMADRQR
jgi:hypothetical protein